VIPTSREALPRDTGRDGEALDEAGANRRLPMAISAGFLADILKPYRAHARYLKSVEITHCNTTAPPDGTKDASLVTGMGRFSIHESCYIDDTGHFNAAEFIICYNQLAYVVFGKCIDADLIHPFWYEKASIPSIAEYKRDQLPRMVIVSIDGVRFLKQMKSDDFRGEFNIKKASVLGSTWFLQTTITFSDCDGVKAKGSVVLAFNPNPPPDQELTRF
jgi:hypothetical protein